MARLLVIEDDQEIAVLLDRYLKRQGHAVALASDGERGVNMFTHGSFDLVITDGLLPKKSGYELVGEIRATDKGKGVGIIMMSAAFRGPQAKKEATTTGVDAFFAKPFVLTELKDSIAELLKQYGHVAPPKPAGPAVPPAAPTAAARPAPPPKLVDKLPDPPPSEPPRIRVVAQPAPREQPRVGTNEQVRAPEEVARLLLRCARQGFTGVARFVDEQNQLQVAFVSGVVVGANDNLREHLLGERLWKQGRVTTEQMRTLNQRMAERNERVAEALLALGLCTADEALQHVEEQSVARARRALAWRGAVQFKETEADAHALATTTLDVADVVVGYALEKTQEAEASRFVVARATNRLSKHPRFEELLMAFARVHPAAKLPGVLLAGQGGTVVEAARASSASELYAAWLAGLVHAEGDPEFDPRPLPDVLRSTRGQGKVDKEAAELICSTLLRARGRTIYELVDEERSADATVVRDKLQELVALCGRDAMAGHALGPAAPAARELWHMLEEAISTFSDPLLRAAYDLSLKPVAPPQKRVSGPEDAFLEGQMALAAGAIPKAVACFRIAVEARPADPDYVSYLGWAEVLAGGRDAGVARLTAALRAHPQAMRPVFFLGMLSAADGDKPRARALLEECARRSPADLEIGLAIASLE